MHEGGNAQPTIDREEHRSVNGVNAKAVVPYHYDGTNLVAGGGGLVPQGYDYIDVSNYTTGGSPQHVEYRVGGAGGTTVATLDITYDASDNPLTVART